MARPSFTPSLKTLVPPERTADEYEITPKLMQTFEDVSDVPQQFKALQLVRNAATATIRLSAPSSSPQDSESSLHAELADVVELLRQDDQIRVVVIEGSDGRFYRPAASGIASRAEWARTVDPERSWTTFAGIIRFHEAMASMDKPVIAKVNGDAIGFGLSIALAADLIYARDDVIFCDHHLGLDGTPGVDRQYALVSGDGCASLLPLYMSPCKAKEFLMLGTVATAREFADLGCINAAVPSGDLDEKVAEVVSALLRRSRFPLGWTKRVANRMLIEQLARTLDSAAAYEMVSFLQLGPEIKDSTSSI